MIGIKNESAVLSSARESSTSSDSSRHVLLFEDARVEKAVDTWRNQVIEYLTPQTSLISLSELTSKIPILPNIPKSVKLLEVLKYDGESRFVITGDGNTFKVKLNFKLTIEETESLQNQWREKISDYLAMQTSSSGLSDIGANVTKPFHLPNSIKLLETMQADPLNRFVLSGEGNSIRARRIFRVDEVEIVQYVEEWRVLIQQYLSYQKVPTSLSDIGSSVLRPTQLPSSVKLVEVLKQDPDQRFILTGEGNYIRAQLKTSRPLRFSSGNTISTCNLSPIGVEQLSNIPSSGTYIKDSRGKSENSDFRDGSGALSNVNSLEHFEPSYVHYQKHNYVDAYSRPASPFHSPSLSHKAHAHSQSQSHSSSGTGLGTRSNCTSGLHSSTGQISMSPLISNGFSGMTSVQVDFNSHLSTLDKDVHYDLSQAQPRSPYTLIHPSERQPSSVMSGSAIAQQGMCRLGTTSPYSHCTPIQQQSPPCNSSHQAYSQQHIPRQQYRSTPYQDLSHSRSHSNGQFQVLTITTRNSDLDLDPQFLAPPPGMSASAPASPCQSPVKLRVAFDLPENEFIETNLPRGAYTMNSIHNSRGSMASFNSANYRSNEVGSSRGIIGSGRNSPVKPLSLFQSHSSDRGWVSPFGPFGSFHSAKGSDDIPDSLSIGLSGLSVLGLGISGTELAVSNDLECQSVTTDTLPTSSSPLTQSSDQVSFGKSTKQLETPDKVMLNTWLPKLFHGYDETLVGTFVTSFRNEGFITVQDLLQAQDFEQLNPTMMQSIAGPELKLGHYNRLIKGLSKFANGF